MQLEERKAQAPSLDRWVEMVRECVISTAAGLGFSSCEATIDLDAEVPFTGTSVSLVAETARVQLELRGERAALEALARGFMMMEPDEELTWEDAADAVSEILNILAGALKSAAASDVPGLRLGLPVFAEGIHQQKLAWRCIRTCIDGIDVTVTVTTDSSS